MQGQGYLVHGPEIPSEMSAATLVSNAHCLGCIFIVKGYTSSEMSGLFPPVPVTSHSCHNTSQWAFSLLVISLGFLFGFVIAFTSYVSFTTFPKDLFATFIADVTNSAPNTKIM
jgi:hypothetical protein